MLFTFISGFLFFIALVCLGTTLIIHCRGFYHLLAQPLKIISESGLTKEVVLRNYDHLIEYCSLFYRGSLSFPDFPSSPSALSHFAETKTLFSYLSLAVPVCFFAGVLLIALKVWGRGKRCLKSRLQIPANLPAEFSVPSTLLHGSVLLSPLPACSSSFLISTALSTGCTISFLITITGFLMLLPTL